MGHKAHLVSTFQPLGSTTARARAGKPPHPGGRLGIGASVILATADEIQSWARLVLPLGHSEFCQQ